MHIQSMFQQNDQAVLIDFIRQHPLGTLVSSGADGLQASPIVFLLYEENDDLVLRAHLPKTNPHWQALVNCAECFIVFQGANGYVSPSWYASKQATHKVVPTWNYATVHVFGQPLIVQDTGWIAKQINDLTDFHEHKRVRPWSVNDAPELYINNLLSTLIGLEIKIARLEAKWKMSQNKSTDDRLGVIAGMSDPNDPHYHAEVAAMIPIDDLK